MQGRLRYDEAKDSFIYEVLGSNGEWGMCMEAKCVRREGAGEDEDTNYVHYGILKKIVDDVQMYGMKLRFA